MDLPSTQDATVTTRMTWNISRESRLQQNFHLPQASILGKGLIQLMWLRKASRVGILHLTRLPWGPIKMGLAHEKTPPDAPQKKTACDSMERSGPSNITMLKQYWMIQHNNSLSQWLNFKLFGITYLVGKIKFKLFFSGSIGWVRQNGFRSTSKDQLNLGYLSGWRPFWTFWRLVES